MRRYKVGLVGATGLVGQRFVQRLAGHPWFELVALAASARSAGKSYAAAASWQLSADPPADVAHVRLRATDDERFDDCDLVFSALDAEIARQVEPRLAAAGLAVVSNSSAFRQQEDVPLLVPEVNAEHLALLDSQRRRTGGGFVVTNPNCSVTGLALVVAPLEAAFGVRRLVVTTLQAVSGAGIEGPRALGLVDNVVPYIAGEEEKIEAELTKILGRVERGALRRADCTVSAHCHRVATLDGHLEAVSLELGRAAAPAEVARVLAEFRPAVAALGLPS
ncbi:MAG TPA: aspartate-semialdehyde dehydrogenase, partial [Candidatus Polarisedimenticolaceae bacterium]|nr:aspartate-semialdehyde dehydrogenase [Candidatus Polarisedimenticolaceae bacterium]